MQQPSFKLRHLWVATIISPWPANRRGQYRFVKCRGLWLLASLASYLYKSREKRTVSSWCNDTDQTNIMQTRARHYHETNWKSQNWSFSWQHRRCFQRYHTQRERMICRLHIWHQKSNAKEGFWLSNTINEPFLSVSVDLNRVMTALWRVEKFNLTILMSSLFLWYFVLVNGIFLL